MFNRRKWRTRVELSTEVFDWIEVFYSRTRQHSPSGMQSPINFEKPHTDKTAAA